MKLFDLFEKSVYAQKVDHTTKYRRLYHLTDNYGLGISVETNTLKALRQDYISTTYRRETDSIMGRQQYHYKFILDGRKLAKKYGVFDYDAKITELGSDGSRDEVSLNEAEVGIDTTEINDLSDYLVGVVILSKPYTDTQVLFLADINRDQRGNFFHDAKSGTISAVTALNRLKVPLYWQEGEAFIPLTEKDHEYLRDIERLMHGIEKSRNMRHLDIVDKLLDKYDIRSNDLIRGKESLDKQIIARKRLVPELMRMLNGYFRDRLLKDINPNDLKNMMIKMMKMMGYGGNAIAVVVGTAEECNFFHPVVEPVNWTGVIRELIAGQIDDAVDDIKHFTPNKWAIQSFEDGRRNSSHAGTGMSGDDD